MPDRADSFDESKVKREKNGRFGAKPKSQTNNATQPLTKQQEKASMYVRDKIKSYLKNPKSLGETTHKQKYDDFKKNDVPIKPLNKGSHKGVLYEQGGGYKVNDGTDNVFQYHPKSKSHHGGEYYKISTGKNGTTRYRMNGEQIEKKGGNNNE